MLRDSKRIEEIIKTAEKNLMKADNHPRDGSNHDYKEFWSLYRNDIRKLLGLVNDYETDLQKYKQWDLDTKQIIE